MGPEITATELSRELREKTDLLLVDVREPHEWEIGHLEGATLIPLQDLPTRWADLDSQAAIVTICHHGIRSMHALEYLQSQGFERVRSLAGGIDAWSTDVDSTVPRY